jgi:hypothetical protein
LAKKYLNKIFLSASIPYPNRNRKFYDTADIIAIRDSVRALATIVIPFTKLIWGGHPSITPLIRFVMEKMNTNLKEHITLYQSNFFKDSFPEDNFFFEDIKLVPENSDRESSLIDLRNAMITTNDYKVGIFIGGMEGVIEEYKFFKEVHPEALFLPVASTGVAAKIIYDQMILKPDERLLNEYTYMALFKDLLNNYLE